MAAKIEFFPVGKGDMTLITLEDGRNIIIDINIRSSADDNSNEDVPDVATILRESLERDGSGRLYVDAFLLTHPHADHCTGLEKHFLLGTPDTWKEKDDKILIREMWSSPIVFRRQKGGEELCDDAKAWWKEARRRVKLYRDVEDEFWDDGNMIQVLGEDKDNKTDDLEDILVKTGDSIVKICGVETGSFTALLLSPLLVSDEDAEELTGKNDSSTVLRFDIQDEDGDSNLFLTGGDSEVAAWERIWDRNGDDPENLEYHILQAPHHCSWHTLSYDSWSDKGKDGEVSEKARNALGQALDGAYVVSSSKPVQDDGDPPCIGAKDEYLDILKDVDGKFLCTGEECENNTLAFVLRGGNPQPENTVESTKSGLTPSRPPISPSKTDKAGGGRYA